MKRFNSAEMPEKSGMNFRSLFETAVQSLEYREKPLLNADGRERKAQVLLLVALTAVCLLPFAGKAFNMDDPLFIWVAQFIQSNPLDPYGFNVNWYETVLPMSEVNKNPPLVSYFIAIAGSVFGWNEPALHIVFLLPAMAVVVGTYLIAGYYCANPILASLAVLFTPVFLVSSTTIMSDLLMLAFWVFAVYFWISGLDKNSNFRLLLSVILVALSALSKYFGMALLPMLLLYSLLKRRNAARSALFMLLPVALLGAYQWATGELYGLGLLTDAGAYAIAVPSAFGKLSFPKLLVGLSFMGGCVLVVLFFTNLAWSRREFFIGVILAAIVTIIAGSTGSLGNYRLPEEDTARWIIALELGIFISGGISLLAIAFLDLIHRKDADSSLLFVWFMGTFVFAAFINWTTAARSILPLVPAAGILIARRIEQHKSGKRISLRRIFTPLIGAAVVALAVTWADYSLANSGRQAAADILDKYINRKESIWFSGHWGFQYYMQNSGARPFDRDLSIPAAGDILVVPSNNTNVVELPSQLVRLHEVLEVPSGGRWITTMSLKTGAGFYSDTWGPLPFAVGSVPLEQYHVFEVRGL